MSGQYSSAVPALGTALTWMLLSEPGTARRIKGGTGDATARLHGGVTGDLAAIHRGRATNILDAGRRYAAPTHDEAHRVTSLDRRPALLLDR